ncbi:TlpA family protein disulfide reductase [Aestuariimicrobium ganziense]|uniref:TlpA family protein disulfide reductase n=1 Tax=Aestuariimicrobium ganziense TaxID=2773677 RepID=UPI0019455FED|nr:TlpA disulfide reductase family protein [Aestuariimicrobium ganziense]
MRTVGLARWGRLLVGALALVVLAGCQDEPGYQFPADSASPTAVRSDLSAQRKAAGIADCPADVAGQEAVAGGLPEVRLECLGGGTGATLSKLPRKPMVLNFWAQWCGPCRDEAPHLAAVARSTKGSVQFIGVNQNDPRPELAIEFAGEAGWSYPQLADELKATRAAPLQVTGLPTTILVSADGRIVHRVAGVIESEEALRALIGEHLGVDA